MQLVHADVALAAAYMPALQSTHVVAFVAAVASEALPAAQLLHIANPTAACLPIGHAAHTEMSRPRDLAYARPAAQLVHAVAALVTFVCLPAGHALHVVAAVVSEY